MNPSLRHKIGLLAIVLAVVAFCGGALLAQRDTTSPYIILADAKENTITVLMDKAQAEHHDKGDKVAIHTSNGIMIQGEVISKNPWFHRTNMTIKIQDKLQ